MPLSIGYCKNERSTTVYSEGHGASTESGQLTDTIDTVV